MKKKEKACITYTRSFRLAALAIGAFVLGFAGEGHGRTLIDEFDGQVTNQQPVVKTYSVPIGGLTLHLKITNTGGHTIGYSFYDSKGRVFVGDRLIGGQSAKYNYTLDDRSGGMFKLSVRMAVGPAESSFQARISYTMQDDGGKSGDAGPSQSTARKIKLDSKTQIVKVKGFLKDRDVEDWYVFQFPADRILMADYAVKDKSRTARFRVKCSNRSWKQYFTKVADLSGSASAQRTIRFFRSFPRTCHLSVLSRVAPGRARYVVKLKAVKQPRFVTSQTYELDWDVGYEEYQTEEVVGSGNHYLNMVKCGPEKIDNTNFKANRGCRAKDDPKFSTIPYSKEPEIKIDLDREKGEWKVVKLIVYSYYVVRRPAEWAYPDKKHRISNNPNDGLFWPESLATSSDRKNRRGYWKDVIDNLKKYEFGYTPSEMKWWARGSTKAHEKLHNKRWKKHVESWYKDAINAMIQKLNLKIAAGFRDPFNEEAVRNEANKIIKKEMAKRLNAFKKKHGANNEEKVVHAEIRNMFLDLIKWINTYAASQGWK